MKHNHYARILISVWAMLITLTIPSGCGSVNGPEGHDPTNVEHLSKCLTDHGARLYGASWCPYTQHQIADFGDSFSNIDYVECTLQTSACAGAGITGYPTWIIAGKVYEGYCDLPTLAHIIGCGE